METTQAHSSTEVMKRMRLIVHGEVQGVGFRWYAYQQAAELGITGYAQNRDDGSVEIEAQGNEEVLATFASAIQRGPRQAQVERVEQIDAIVQNDEQGFQMH